MRKANDDEQMMRQFLLDKLDLDARERIEEHFLTDDVFREKLLMAEESLIEDYLDNSLDDFDRERFHSVFLSSAEQREKLIMARAITAVAKAEVEQDALVAQEGSENTAALAAGRGTQRATKHRIRSAIWIAAVIVLATFVFAAAWLIRRGPRELEDREELARRLAIQAELAELNSGPRSGSQMAPGETFSIVLAPINIRSSGPPNLLRRTGVLVFEFWLLPTSLDYVNFKALLKDGAGGQFEVSNLPLVEKPQGRAVRLRIPAHLLNPGAYQVELSALRPDGNSVYVGEYRFQIAN